MMIVIANESIYEAAIYCRLSKDDEQSGESASIETQKMMLTRYCMDHNIEIFNIYVDDGYSGLNFNRPSFKRLIQDLEDGKFNTVITKDLSRLGRDYIQTGYYIDIYFTSKRVRYIAVNDGIDTKNENNDIAPFKNILNDMYAKDLSRKVKSAKRQRAQNGMYISSQPPYGYKVNPYNRNQLIIDDEVAPVVKMIFQLAESGKSLSEISRFLENKKYLSPSAHKAMNGDTRFLRFTESASTMYRWSYQMVRIILTNPIYVGDMVNHKHEIVNYKTKKRVRVPREEQIIVPNMHEAIIERSLFKSVNAKILTHHKPNHNYENALKGLLFCAECGTEMNLISVSRKSGYKPMFRCLQHSNNKKLCTHYHFIYYDELISEVQNQLKLIFEEYSSSNQFIELCELIKKDLYVKLSEKRRLSLQSELTSINKQLKMYYKKALPTPSESIDSENINYLLEQKKKIANKIGELSFEKPCLETENLILGEALIKIKHCIYKIALSEKTLNRLIRKIEISHLLKKDNTTYQNIIIHYTF